MKRPLVAAIVLGAHVCASIALAQPVSRAEELFQEGRGLLKEGRVPEACAKLEESYRLEAAPGTLLNLALCHEERGMLATALREYREVRDRARADATPERQAAANDRIADLEAKVNRLTILVPGEARVPSLSVTLDGAPVASEAYGNAQPIDRGTHVVVATVDRAERFRQQVVLDRPGESRAIEVVLSAPTPSAQSAPVPTLTYVLGGVGIVSLLVAGGFGVRALSLKSELEDCKPSCDDDRIDAMRATLVTFDVLTAVGLVSLGAAGVVYFLRPTPRAPADRSVLR
jgi:hypothetical protein